MSLPTDDVKALIEEARATAKPENARFFRELLAALNDVPALKWDSRTFTRPDGAPIETVDHVVEATTHSARQSETAALHGVVLASTDRVMCYTGNGPSSEAHARYLAYLMPQNVRHMLNTLGEQEELIARLAAALSDADAAGYARGIEEAARVADAHATFSKDLRDHYKGAGQADVAHVWECACTQIKALANDVRRLKQEQTQ